MISIAFNVALFAQPILIKQVPQYSENYTGTSNLLYYTSSDTLYRSDGTTAGTFAIKTGLNEPRLLTGVGNRLYFIDNGGNGNRLWTSTGTTASTISIGTFTEISDLHSFGNLLVFAATTSIGREPWKSNGTAAGTVLIKDINPGPASGLEEYMDFEPVNNYVYFAANNGINGTELWKSDGTSGGTSMVKDIIAGTGSSHPVGLIKVGNLLFFDTQNPDYTLWKTDGTASGTITVLNYNDPDDYYGRISSVDINGVLYFGLAYAGGTTVWKSNGTPAGTQAINVGGYNTNDVKELFNANGNLVISNNADGEWALIYYDVNTGSHREIDGGHYNHKIVTLGNYIFYNNDLLDMYGDVISKDELSQATVPNISSNLVINIFPYLNTSYDNVDNMTVVGNTLYFTSTSHTLSRFLYKYTPMQFGINSFTLVNSVTDTDIRSLKNGDTIYTNEHVNIRANTFGNVHSVKFFINDNPYNLESSAPYSLAGDNSGNYNEWVKPSGFVKITAIPYTGTGATGTAGTPATFTVRIIPPSDTLPSQINYTLVNALNNTDIGPLVNGQVINVSALPTNKLNIRANSTLPGTQSVVFSFDGIVNYRTENTAPYSLFGDENGDYNQWTAVNGTHTLSATPYTGKFGTGTSGRGKTITFTVINSSARLAYETYPNPADDFVTVQVADGRSQRVDVHISDLSGKEYYSGPMDFNAGNLNVELNNMDMKPGMYIIRFISEGESNTVKFLKK